MPNHAARTPANDSPLGPLTLLTLTLATFFAASSVPTPIYRLYQQAWGFSSGMLTLVFGIYALSLLLALLTTGPLSDYLGRRPVILAALALEMAGMGIFVGASGVGWLIAARVVQGFATGMAASVLGAATLDVDRHRGPLLNGVAPLVGMAVGALGASMLVQYAPAPLRLVYLLLLAIFALQAVGVFALGETVTPRPGALAAMRPRIVVPRAARGALWRVAPVNVAVWALGGFYLSLGPTLARAATHSTAVTTGGWVVFTLTVAGVVAILLLRGMNATKMLFTGSLLLAAGVLVTLVGVHASQTSVFFIGTTIAGTGFGVAFQGALRSLLPLAQPHERAGLLAAFYVLSYLAFSIPAIVVGVLVPKVGLRMATDVYGTALVVLALLTALGIALPRRRATSS
ncbi:MAG: MFS transporter [Janthinobacterium lividum]